jgi:hypothetical protein
MLAMKSSGSISKDQTIYLAVLDASVAPEPQTNEVRTYSYDRVYKISAGGPSRGSILLDATEGPRAGTKVQVRSIHLSTGFSLT